MLYDKRILAIIPARAGSKGFPGKNHKTIMNQPLFRWSIDASCSSSCIDTTVVTTNCQHVILGTKSHRMFATWYCWGERKDKTSDLKFKLYSIERPEELCTDDSSTEPAMVHALDEMEKSLGVKYDYVVLLQPTSPARTNNLIDKCLKKMVEEGYDSLMTVSSHTPFFWKVKDGKSIPDYDPNNRPRRQDILDEEIMYHDNGNIYITEADNLRVNGRIGSNPLLYETTTFESMQIDTEEDFRLMEGLAKQRGSLL